MRNLFLIFSKINKHIIDDIGRQAPQIKKYIDCDIKDITTLGYLYPSEIDYDEVTIDGKIYYVDSLIFQYKKEVGKYECQILSPSDSTIEKLYNIYLGIVNHPNLLSISREKNGEIFWVYDNFRRGHVYFPLMKNEKNQIVYSLLFCLYH